MLIRKVEGTQDRLIIIAMITNRQVLAQIAAKWPQHDGPFASTLGNLIGGWCVKFFRKYDAPPMKQIEGLFSTWAEKHATSDDTVRLVEDFLVSLSGEYDGYASEVNPDYILDIAGTRFTLAKASKVRDELDAAIVAGDTAKIGEVMTDYRRVDVGESADINILHDEEAWEEALAENEKSLITYPGALGQFLGDSFSRGSFIAFMGPEKRGKTWMLLDVAWRAMLQRKRVAFFEVGDMTKAQIDRRFMIRATAHPRRPCTVRYPTSITAEGTDASVTFEESVYDDSLNFVKASEAFANVRKSKIKSEEDYLKLRCYPAATLTVERIATVIEEWVAQGWIPDVIVIDYADLLATPNGRLDMRDRINEVWVQLRSLSQKYHCLVVTATQANRASYDAHTISMKHSSEDKRKLAHVTGMIGLNCTPEEKKNGVLRLNWIVRREEEYQSAKCVYLAQCLALAQPAVRSCFRTATEDDKEETTPKNGKNRLNGNGFNGHSKKKVGADE